MGGEHIRYIFYAPSNLVSVLLDIYEDGEEDECVWIWNLYTCPTYRSKGLATRILDKVEQFVRLLGYEYVCIEWCNNTPEWVLNWYMRRGYDCYKQTEETTYLRKKLKN